MKDINKLNYIFNSIKNMNKKKHYIFYDKDLEDECEADNKEEAVDMLWRDRYGEAGWDKEDFSDRIIEDPVDLELAVNKEIDL